MDILTIMCKTKKIAVVSILPCVVLFLFSFRFFLKGLANYLPPCMWYTLYGICCPGCGMTRAMLAILDGNVLLSLRENAFFVFCMIAIVLVYLQCVFRVFSRKVCFFSKNILFWVMVAIAFIMYVVLRNFIPEIAPI